MKRAITILLALLMVLSLAACGGSSTTTSTPAPTEAPATPEPTPETTPETTPEPTPETTPEPTPETTPEPTPEPVPTKNPDAIDLTVENCEKYLVIDKLCSCGMPVKEKKELYVGSAGTYGLPLGNGSSTMYLYGSLDYICVDVKGATQNFNFNDVSITLRCSGTYTDIYWKDKDNYSFEGQKDFSTEITIECNIAGTAYKYVSYDLPADHYTHRDLIDAEWEIISISGNVTPA